MFKGLKIFPWLVILALLPSCHVGRYFIWNFADIRDYKKFPYETITTSGNPFYFYINKNKNLFSTVEYLNKSHDLDSLLRQKKSKTVAFLVIKNDTILYEEYFKRFDQQSIFPSFSMAKSFTSALIGIAISEGKIPSVQTPISDYLPELCNSNEDFQNITVEHLLNMRSGIEFNERSFINPFKGIAKLYYGRKPKKQIGKIKLIDAPGEHYEYQSINTQILGVILEKATGVSPASYLEEKIWKPLGMESDASWSIDNKKDRTVKTYCCLNAIARDFAKFGRLYLNGGIWNGQQIVPQEWVKRSITPTPPYRRYQYHWYSTTRPVYFNDSLSAVANRQGSERIRRSRRYPEKYFINRYGPAFVASGLLGQSIYVDPSKNLIIVRIGKQRGNISWWELFDRISEKL